MLKRAKAELSMRMTRHVVFMALSGLGVLSGMQGAGALPLLPHTAVYDVSLDSVSDTSDIESLTGRWVFDFSGSACEGYTAKSRLVMKFETADGPRLIDRRVSSFESADGKSFKFESQSYAEDDLEEEVRGSASVTDEGVKVEYTMPEKTEISFGPALFPSAQVFDMLEKARAGVHFYETAVFDGTEMIDEPVTVSVVLGKPKELTGKARSVVGKLAGEKFLPVTMAYFEPMTEREGEHVASYDVSFKIHESGIQSDIVIRYDEYAMAADLVELTFKDVDSDCRKEK